MELALQLRKEQTAECSSTGQQSSRKVTQYEVVECSSVCNTLAQDITEMIAAGWQLWPRFVSNGCIFPRCLHETGNGEIQRRLLES